MCLWTFCCFLLDEWGLGEHTKIHTGQARYFCSVFNKDSDIPLQANKLPSVDKSAADRIKIPQKLYDCNVSISIVNVIDTARCDFVSVVW